MQSFVNFLIEKGYISFVLKDGIYIKSNEPLSTIGRIDYRFFHKYDPIIKKIEQGLSVNNGGITRDDRKGEIVWGLHEVGFPPTLIYPRPSIYIRTENGFTYPAYGDAVMGRVLQDYTNKEIFEAMYNKDISFIYKYEDGLY